MGSTDVDRVLAAAWERHAPISQWFGSGEGLRLQNVDSDVCEHVVLTLTRAGIPVLPIHDGFRTRERDEGRLREAMLAGLVRRAGVREPAGFLPDAS